MHKYSPKTLLFFLIPSTFWNGQTFHPLPPFFSSPLSSKAFYPVSCLSSSKICAHFGPASRRRGAIVKGRENFGERNEVGPLPISVPLWPIRWPFFPMREMANLSAAAFHPKAGHFTQRAKKGLGYGLDSDRWGDLGGEMNEWADERRRIGGRGGEMQNFEENEEGAIFWQNIYEGKQTIKEENCNMENVNKRSVKQNSQ